MKALSNKLLLLFIPSIFAFSCTLRDTDYYNEMSLDQSASGSLEGPVSLMVALLVGLFYYWVDNRKKTSVD